jgi:hypothetical protein
MLAHFVRFLHLPAVLSLLLLAACASETPLISKNATVPEGVDLSGRWIMRVDSNTQRPRAAGRQERVIPTRRPQRSGRQKFASGGSVQVFIEYGRSLKITQTNFGIFVSYDRSIVEEFTFGENRIVSIGPIEALRVSGWEGNSFVVETRDESGTTLYESWYFGSDDSVLIRDIRISKGEDETFTLQQVFDSQEFGG